jgi:hypothetical protein
MRRVSETFDGQRLVQAIPRERERDPYPVRLRLHLRDRRELRLAAGAAMIDDQLARDLARQRRAVICLNERERQVDAGRHSGGTPDVMIRDEDPVGVDLNRGIALLQPMRHAPMRRGAFAVEEAGFGEQEGAGADAGDPRGSAGEARDGVHFAGSEHRCDLAAADDEGIRPCPCERLGRDRHAAATGDEAASP